MSSKLEYENDKWAKQATHWEYFAAATPDLKEIPIEVFPADLHETGATRIIPLDISHYLVKPYAATSPNLLVNYLRICKGEKLRTQELCSSEIFYCMEGRGKTETEFGVIEWEKGDAFTMPSNSGAMHQSEVDSSLVWANDTPLLKYIGAEKCRAKFKPAFYCGKAMHQTIEKIKEQGIAEKRNRNGIILGNTDCSETKTITHTMWSLNNLITANSIQKAHRHQSVAVDLALSAAENTYTLIGRDLDAEGNILNPIKAMWNANSIFITPPGYWHSHHNESEQNAYVFPFQDAGLHTYMRTLDIQFVS